MEIDATGLSESSKKLYQKKIDILQRAGVDLTGKQAIKKYIEDNYSISTQKVFIGAVKRLPSQRDNNDYWFKAMEDIDKKKEHPTMKQVIAQHKARERAQRQRR